MSDRFFECSVVTPERVVSEGEARFVSLPAHDGEIGILRRRAPLVCKLDAGRLRIERPGGETETLFVDGGFAEMLENRLTVLTPAVRTPEELDRASAQQALETARALAIRDDESFAERQRALRAARVQLRMLQGDD